jgi:inosose dehydratase
MSFLISRRRFAINLATWAAASAVPVRASGAFSPPLYPPIDLSYFESPVSPAPAEIRFGYAAITWGGADTRAISDISEVGFRGIQLRASAVKQFGDKPKELASLLERHKLTFVALSGGGPDASLNLEQELTRQIGNANFLLRAGGLYLQMTDSARPKDRKPNAADFKSLGKLLTETGKRTRDIGVPMAYHNHMHSLGESPEEVDALMDASDPRYVRLLLDVAHYAQGGGDPAQAIRKYRDRILFLHIKDVETVPAGENDQPYRFVELGRGRVDLAAVFSALKEIKFRGWAIVELDSVPDQKGTPKDSAIISRKYLEEKLGIKI